MGLPAKLKIFTLYNDGFAYLGQVSEVTLPKLVIATEEYRGGNMIAPVDVDLGLEKLEMETKTGGLTVGVMRQFGLTRIDGAMLRYVGAYQADDSPIPIAAELVVRGRHTEIDMGTAKAGDDTETMFKTTIAYLKWSINGRTEVEIDVLNSVFMVDGRDRYAALRAIIGG